MFMWADDEAYTTWGREVFGWPILRGEFTFEGTIWDSPLAAGAPGSAMLQASAGRASLIATCGSATRSSRRRRAGGGSLPGGASSAPGWPASARTS